jgi:hypothetical protein
MRWCLLLLLAACSNAANPAPDASAMLDILVINELAAEETPDWFEIVNVTSGPVQLDQFVYVDTKGDFVKAKALPPVTLPAGAYFTQDVDDVTSGFKLASDESLWVYRTVDQVLSDGVDWNQDDSPTGMSFARSPDRSGPFRTSMQTKGLPNP